MADSLTRVAMLQAVFEAGGTGRRGRETYQERFLIAAITRRALIFRRSPLCTELGAVPPDSPLITWAWSACTEPAPPTWRCNETDLLLVFGARLDDRVTGEPTRFAPHAKIVHFEIDPAQLDRVRPCDLPVIGNLADTIPAFRRNCARHSLPDFSRVAFGRLRCGPCRT